MVLSRTLVIGFVFWFVVLYGLGVIAVAWAHRKKIHSPSRKK